MRPNWRSHKKATSASRSYSCANLVLLWSGANWFECLHSEYGMLQVRIVEGRGVFVNKRVIGRFAVFGSGGHESDTVLRAAQERPQRAWYGLAQEQIVDT